MATVPPCLSPLNWEVWEDRTLSLSCLVSTLRACRDMPCGVLSARAWRRCVYGHLLTDGCKSELCPETLWPFPLKTPVVSCDSQDKILTVPTAHKPCSLTLPQTSLSATLLAVPLSGILLLAYPPPVSDGGIPFPPWVSDQKCLPLYTHTHYHLRRALGCSIISTCVFSSSHIS